MVHVLHVLLSISLGFKHAYSLSSRPKRDRFQYHTGSDLRWDWFGFGAETNMHVWCVSALALDGEPGCGTFYGKIQNVLLALMRTHHTVM